MHARGPLGSQIEALNLRSQTRPSRVRTGCITCRRRRVKCDETRPVCIQCTRYKKDCTYIQPGHRLIWEEDNILLGKCHGRAGIWSKHSKQSSQLMLPPEIRGRSEENRCTRSESSLSIEQREAQTVVSVPLQFLNATVEHLRLYYKFSDIGSARGRPTDTCLFENSEEIQNELAKILLASSRDAFIPYFDRLYTRLSFFPSNKEVSETEGLLLYYFECIVCEDGRHIVEDDEKDPLPYMLLRATHSRAIYLGILLSSANFLKGADPSFVMVALEYRQLALMFLMNLLEFGGDSTDIMMVAVMLCSSEIWDGCNRTWVTHLGAYRHALEQSPKDDYLYRLCCRYLGYHLVMAKAAFNLDDDISLLCCSGCSWTTTENLARTMPQQTLRIIDPYSAMSNALLLMINDIVDLKRNGSRGRHVKKGLLTPKILELKQNLQNLDQILPHWVTAKNPETVASLRQTAEANRLAALLLLHESFVSSDSLDEKSCNFKIPGVFDEYEKGTYIKEVLRLVEETFSYPQLTVSWPLWPLFMAGCCVNSEEDKITVIKLFEWAQRKLDISNIRPAFEVVQAVWQQRELSADEEVSPRTIRRRKEGQKAIEREEEIDQSYEWERVMIMMNYRISLA